MPETSKCSTLLALLAAGCLAGCGAEPPPAESPLRPVRVVTVGSGSVTTQRTLAGVVRAAVEARLSFRVGGTIERVGVAVGDRVRRGQLMARLDPTDFELRVEQAEAALAQAAALQRRAGSDYERVRALYENNNASKSELDAGRAGAESARAQVEAAQKQLEQARQQLRYATLTAPFAGAVAEVDVEVNENVRSGQAVFVLTGGEGLEVEVAVPEGMIHQVYVGQPVRVELPALPGRDYPGSVAEVGIAATGSSATFDVVARLLGETGEMRSGMAAEVTFAIEREGEHIVVPSVSVGEDGEGRYVFVVETGAEGEATVRRRAVTVGPPSGALTEIEIVEGLAPGEVVVTAGVRRLSDGMRVQSVSGGDDGA